MQVFQKKLDPQICVLIRQNQRTLVCIGLSRRFGVVLWGFPRIYLLPTARAAHATSCCIHRHLHDAHSIVLGIAHAALLVCSFHKFVLLQSKVSHLALEVLCQKQLLLSESFLSEPGELFFFLVGCRQR